MTIAITPEAAERAAAALPGDHRWEITPEGNLVLMSPANARQAKIVMQLAAWFVRGGIDPVCVLSEVGIHTIAEGLRGPDLAVFNAEPGQDGPWASTDELAVVIEVFSPSTRRTDEGDKVDEYARIGCPQYWTAEPLDNGDALVVVRLLGVDRRYLPGRSVLLSELLTTDVNGWLAGRE
jgi:Uma2 family endonuclease